MRVGAKWQPSGWWAGIMRALTFSNTQGKALANKEIELNGRRYRFAAYVPPGSPGWRMGYEGAAYPLHDTSGAVSAYVKFFKKAPKKRIERTRWLIGQRMAEWSAGLAAAPRQWVDTRLHSISRPDGVEFDFAGYFMEVVPGKTWDEVKADHVERRTQLVQNVRQRAARDLIQSLAVLEMAGVVHGDLSPLNVMLNTAAPVGRPVLYVIDFDAFVAKCAGKELARLTASEGGTIGTDGYRPPDIASRRSDPSPYSDSYGRDMLLLELLCFGTGFDRNAPPSEWDAESLESLRRLDSIGNRLEHLRVPQVFSLAEEMRPSSVALAKNLGIDLPSKPPIRRIAVARARTSPPRPKPAAPRSSAASSRPWPVPTPLPAPSPAPASMPSGWTPGPPSHSIVREAGWLVLKLVAFVALVGLLFGDRLWPLLDFSQPESSQSRAAAPPPPDKETICRLRDAVNRDLRSPVLFVPRPANLDPAASNHYVLANYHCGARKYWCLLSPEEQASAVRELLAPPYPDERTPFSPGTGKRIWEASLQSHLYRKMDASPKEKRVLICRKWYSLDSHAQVRHVADAMSQLNLHYRGQACELRPDEHSPPYPDELWKLIARRLGPDIAYTMPSDSHPKRFTHEG